MERCLYIRPPVRHAWVGHVLRWTLCFVGLALLTQAGHAQGCAQCLDSTRATPPAVQAAYRHAILLLLFSAAGLFLGGIALLRRNR